MVKRMKNKTTGRVGKCAFWDDVLCSFRKTERFAIMDRCLKCSHFARFNREMDEEDEKVMDEIEKIQKYGYPKRFG